MLYKLEWNSSYVDETQGTIDQTNSAFEGFNNNIKNVSSSLQEGTYEYILKRFSKTFSSINISQRSPAADFRSIV